MQNRTSKDYLSKVNLYYEKYILGSSPMPDRTDCIDPEIWASWKRSKKAGVDPNYNSSNAVSPDELRKTLQSNKILLEAAEPYIKGLYDFVRGTNFVIHLTDSKGCLLKYYADDAQINNLFKQTSLLQEGSIRIESISGTDSAALCLKINKPAQVIGAEHYLKRNHIFFCSSSPIHDTTGAIIGVLTIMGPKELHQDHTLGMAYSATNGIELELQKRKSFDKLAATNILLDTITESLSAGIVVIDETHKILQYNKRFTEIFKLAIDDYHHRVLFEILKQESFPRKVKAFDKELGSVPFTVTTMQGTSVNIFTDIKPITIASTNTKLTMLTFKEEREMHAIANKISTSNAVFTFDSIIGNSAAIMETKRLGKTAASSISNVLIQGESGTGKELLAQSIHNASSRRREPFIAINCGSIPKDLIESELFGYEGGAFTGAKQDGRPGKFELANGGTLFLDEIGDMPLELQTSLLRVLQSHEIVRVGGGHVKYLDVRIIAATNVDLIRAVNNRTFRSDLYYRLNVLNIWLPPLRDRNDDIPFLVNKFINTYTIALKKGPCTISNDALYMLSQYNWPGNIRELENVIERAINIMQGTQITKTDLPDYITKIAELNVPPSHKTSPEPSCNLPVTDLTDSIPAEDTLSPLIKERASIIDLMKQEKGHVDSVARRLDIPSSTLYRKLKKYNINVKGYKIWI